MKKLFGFSLLLLALLLTVGCGGGSKDKDDTVSISLTPPQVTVETGKLALFIANAKNTEITLPTPGSLDGTYVQVGRYGVSYTAPAAPTTVDFTVSASADHGKTATSKINVIWARPTLTFTPSQLNAQPGSELEFTIDTRYFPESPKTDINVALTAIQKTFDYEDCKDNRNCDYVDVPLGEFTITGYEYDIEIKNANGERTDFIDIRTFYTFTPYSDLEVEDGIYGTVSAAGVYDNDLPVVANARLGITSGLVLGRPSELADIPFTGDGLWGETKKKPTTYNPILDDLNIPDEAYVFEGYGQTVPQVIVGYTKIDGQNEPYFQDLKPGEWGVYTQEFFGMVFPYIVIIPKEYETPSELAAIPFTGDGLWGETNKKPSTYNPVLDGLNIPDTAYVYEGYGQTVPQVIVGYKMIDGQNEPYFQDLKPGEWGVYTQEFFGMVFPYIVVAPHDFN